MRVYGLWEEGRDMGGVYGVRGELLVVLLSRRFCCIVYAMYVVL